MLLLDRTNFKDSKKSPLQGSDFGIMAEFYATIEGEVSRVDDPLQMSDDGSNDETVEGEYQDQSGKSERKKVG